MKVNFKNNYPAETAAHYTTFPQTERSSRILAGNRRTPSDIAAQTADTITNRATRKARNNLLGGNFNIFV